MATNEDLYNAVAEFAAALNLGAYSGLGNKVMESEICSVESF